MSGLDGSRPAASAPSMAPAASTVPPRAGRRDARARRARPAPTRPSTSSGPSSSSSTKGSAAGSALPCTITFFPANVRADRIHHSPAARAAVAPDDGVHRRSRGIQRQRSRRQVSQHQQAGDRRGHRAQHQPQPRRAALPSQQRHRGQHRPQRGQARHQRVVGQPQAHQQRRQQRRAAVVGVGAHGGHQGGGAQGGGQRIHLGTVGVEHHPGRQPEAQRGQCRQQLPSPMSNGPDAGARPAPPPAPGRRGKPGRPPRRPRPPATATPGRRRFPAAAA